MVVIVTYDPVFFTSLGKVEVLDYCAVWRRVFCEFRLKSVLVDVEALIALATYADLIKLIAAERKVLFFGVNFVDDGKRGFSF